MASDEENMNSEEVRVIIIIIIIIPETNLYHINFTRLNLCQHIVAI